MTRAFFEVIDVFPPQQRKGKRCFYRAAPGIVVSRRGTVFAVNQERVGTIGDSFNRKNVVLRRSKDDGTSWLPMQVLVSEEGFDNGTGPVLVDDETGRVFIIYGRSPVEDEASGHDEIWRIEHPEYERQQLVIHSDDEGETWSQPQDISEALIYEAAFSTHWGEVVKVGRVRMHVQSGYSPGAGIQLKHGAHRGRLLAPARLFVKPVWDINVYAHNSVLISDDHGATWRVGGLSQPGAGECCIVELADGTLYLNSRNESVRFRGYRSWDRSYDGGESFTESGYDLTLVEPHCHASIARYSSISEGKRNRILFCNPAVHSDTVDWFDGPARRNLTVRLSYDECRTWPVAKVVWAGPAGYSGLTVTPQGTILCHFERGAGPEGLAEGCSSVARFNLAWLTDGRDDGC